MDTRAHARSQASQQRLLRDATPLQIALQFGHDIVLDLAHAFARHAQAQAQHLQRLGLAIVQAEAAFAASRWTGRSACLARCRSHPRWTGCAAVRCRS